MKPTRYWPLAAAVAASLGLGCDKTAEQRQSEAEKAANQAEKTASKATQEANEKMGEAQQKVTQDTQEFLATVTREQSDYRGKIQDETRRIEKRLTDLKVDLSNKDAGVTYDKTSKSGPEIEKLLGRRDALSKDMDAIGHTAARDWSALKARIDRDLSEEGTRGIRTGT